MECRRQFWTLGRAFYSVDNLSETLIFHTLSNHEKGSSCRWCTRADEGARMKRQQSVCTVEVLQIARQLLKTELNSFE